MNTFRLVDGKHDKAIVGLDVGDNDPYHQDPGDGENANWTLEPSTVEGYFHIRNTKHGKYLVASHHYDTHVYFQYPGTAPNGRWRLDEVGGANGGVYHITDHKHNRAITVPETADGKVYQGEPDGSARFQWTMIETDAAGKPIASKGESKAAVAFGAGQIMEKQFEPDDDAIFEFTVTNTSDDLVLNKLSVDTMVVRDANDAVVTSITLGGQEPFSKTELGPGEEAVGRILIASKGATPGAYRLEPALSWQAELAAPNGSADGSFSIEVAQD